MGRLDLEFMIMSFLFLIFIKDFVELSILTHAVEELRCRFSYHPIDAHATLP